MSTTPEELALLWGTFIVGRWAEVMADDTEPADDWQEQAAAEAVALFRPAFDDMIAEVIDARLAPIRALAEEWEGWASNRSSVRIDAFRDAAEALRAALRADPAAPQPTSGTEGQDEGKRASERHVDPTTLDGIYDDLTTIRIHVDTLLAKVASFAGGIR